jgi:hypothetical protein
MERDMIGPMPGTRIRRSHPASRLAGSPISVDKPSMRLSVIRSDGTLSGYCWGVERKRALLKRALLAREGA